MPPEEKQWKKARRVQDKGVDVYITKGNLKEFAEHPDVDLDLDEEIECRIRTGVSDGRPRAFVQFRNPPE